MDIDGRYLQSIGSWPAWPLFMDGVRYTGAASTMGAALRQGGHTARAMLEKGWQAMNRVPGLHGRSSQECPGSRCPKNPRTMWLWINTNTLW